MFLLMLCMGVHRRPHHAAGAEENRSAVPEAGSGSTEAAGNVQEAHRPGGREGTGRNPDDAFREGIEGKQGKLKQQNKM